MFLTKDKKATILKLIFVCVMLLIFALTLILSLISNKIDFHQPIKTWLALVVAYTINFIVLIWLILIQVCLLNMIQKGKNSGLAFKLWKFLTFNSNKKCDNDEEILNSSISTNESFANYVQNKRNVILLIVMCVIWILTSIGSDIKNWRTLFSVNSTFDIFRIILWTTSVITNWIWIISTFIKNMIVYLAKKTINNEEKLTKYKEKYLKLSLRK
ncbi:hypothetical protein HUN03_00478 [Mycoplasmopsis anatis]|uniref:hypothetical protein n=1 Tax=Mycoplasmopsis anatis TaxID=171279 RepID=UPI001C4E085B|nr:hypothetical protein [Mycoplasmopsis anatis]MBW0594814.1 hypothetical protein [Mycoplasmopsis anatis]MBW0595711.1 hypothetical protein [Mycoplasmopsis anatis]MBW0598618.1 hypothetical protein [Mycoplasmopsis anatis]MBW0599193.1 hypothetical protein [Mycoplasmopsis anatis]MBW0601390.1 hypothetical protein [Mycoplasmopsis anatis]